MTLLDEVLGAHGGRERWAAARTIRWHGRAGGLLIRTRVHGGGVEGELEARVAEPVLVASPYPLEGRRAVFDHGSVRIETDDGEVLESRERPRELFFGRPGVRRNLRWDTLDTAYFAGYAWWNYLTTPYLLTRDEVTVHEIEPWRERAGGEIWRRLEARFGAGIDTHSERQTFYYDAELRLRRHDYVAEVVGGWAHAAHMCADHVEAGGLLFPTRRWVRPIGPRNSVMPAPTLVSLQLSEIEVQ
ncbi:MAG TPA: hypothetical protein VD765_09615 [Solirubrobacterales bacterium]|nr:hypothetical protein [Solirubrobacterales bacterium]